jgi:hypothetical protein
MMNVRIWISLLPVEGEQSLVNAVGGFSRTGEFLLVPVRTLSDLRQVLGILRRYRWMKN